ncbi:MAG: ABC transporter permease [Chitinophagaceae bacterium]
MLKNYFKIAWRNLQRHKMYALINTLGLALGMTCCLFIFLWVRDEKSVDSFGNKGKSLYAVYQTVTANGKTDGSYSTPLKVITGQNIPSFLLENLKDAVPDVKYQAYYTTGYELPWGHAETFQVGEKKVKLEGSRAGKDFFKIFDFPLIEGNADNALKDLTGIAVSRKMAELFFDNAHDAIGKTLRYENRQDFTVTAVFENLPTQSTFRFDYLFNWEAQKKLLQWASNDFQSYVQLTDKADSKHAAAAINQFLLPQLEKKPSVQIEMGLQPFSEKYLHSTFVNGKPATGRIEYVKIFSGIAIFILLIACINFMNLATAQSVKRAKEVGLRKVVGSSRANLIGQFLGESLIFSLLAMLLSLLLIVLLLPAFNHFANKEISLPFTQLSFWIFMISLVTVTGLIAGSYPALYLSSLKPIKTLKGVLRFSQSAVWFRKSLTVFQFALSIFLLVATIVITRQTNYVQNTNLGYDKENLIYTRIEGELAKENQYRLFKDKLNGMPGIAVIDRSSEAPHIMDFVVTDAINWEGKDKNASVGFKPSSVGFDFIKLMNLQVVEGRCFSKEIGSDSTDAFMINEEAVRQIGIKNPIGKWISAWQKKGHIIGVLKDFHTQSLREAIKPVVIDVKEYEYFGVIIARTKPGETKQALASLASVYKDINPNYPFTYEFVDEEYKRLYSSELVVSKLAVLFATLAISISCMGLLGLVMFSAEQRVKEIGIRKVLGASMAEIVSLFSKEFLSLILIAFLIAAPLGWLGMHKWLQNFAYKIDISWWIFVLAGGVAILTALLTVCYQSYKAAVANPVKSLRTE